jgi:hypothetical protein
LLITGTGNRLVASALFLHSYLGWNFTGSFVFPNGNIGNGVLIKVAPHHTPTVSYFPFFFVIYFPVLAMLIKDFLLLKRKKQDEG